jgi:Ser-tRNA(Ala) deacylase AlaX
MTASDLNHNDPTEQNGTAVAVTTETKATAKTDHNQEPTAVEESSQALVPSTLQLPPTDMLYYTYEGNRLTTCPARVLSIQENKTAAGSSSDSDSGHGDDDAVVIVDVCLDQTVLHAQGGGQPTDFGSLSLLVQNDDSHQDEGETPPVVVVHVDKVLLDRSTGVATHTGRLQVTPVAVGNNESSSSSSKRKIMLQVGDTVQVTVDEERRQILSECHTAGHGMYLHTRHILHPFILSCPGCRCQWRRLSFF